MSLLRHLHRFHSYVSTFGIVFVHDRLLCRHDGVCVSRRHIGGVHSVHPGSDVIVVLSVGSGVLNTDELETPITEFQIRKSDVSITTEVSYRLRPIVLRGVRPFVKKPTRDCCIKVQYLAERRVEAVDSGPAIEPSPKKPANGGCGSADKETAASAAVDVTQVNVPRGFVHLGPPPVDRLDKRNPIPP